MSPTTAQKNMIQCLEAHHGHPPVFVEDMECGGCLYSFGGILYFISVDGTAKSC